MSLLTLYAEVLGVVFFSTLVRAAFGFGNALLAMPLLILLLGPKSAAPLSALVGLVTAVAMLARDWHDLQLKEVLTLLLASLAGIPLGLYLLAVVPERIVKAILGLVLIGFGAFNLSGMQTGRTVKAWLALPAGFLAGVLGGAYNTNGPPVVIYGLLRGWPRDKFRISLQGYFLITGLVIAAGHGLAGLWTPRVIYLFLGSIPAVMLAVLGGEWLAARFQGDRFTRAVNLVLILLGILMFL
jgi:uncharacterized membrane protein YfcA